MQTADRKHANGPRSQNDLSLKVCTTWEQRALILWNQKQPKRRESCATACVRTKSGQPGSSFGFCAEKQASRYYSHGCILDHFALICHLHKLVQSPLVWQTERPRSGEFKLFFYEKAFWLCEITNMKFAWAQWRKAQKLSAGVVFLMFMSRLESVASPKPSLKYFHRSQISWNVFRIKWICVLQFNIR